MNKTAPVTLDLATLNASQEVAITSIQNLVCEWEQKAIDCGAQGDWRSAQQYKEWAFSADLIRHQVSVALGALFLDSLQSLPIITEQRTVQLPDLRSDEDRRLDDLTVEVLSHQPDPF